MFLLYPFYAIGSLLITLLSVTILNPIVMLFVDKDGNLPKYLSYFQTFDSPIPEGYFAGLKWLNRNPCYGFDLFVFGLKWEPEKWKVHKMVSNSDIKMLFATNNYGAFNFYYSNETKEQYVKLGWKAFNIFNWTTGTFVQDWNTFGRVPLCFSLMWKQ